MAKKRKIKKVKSKLPIVKEKCGWVGCNNSRTKGDLFCHRHEQVWQEELAQAVTIYGGDDY